MQKKLDWTNVIFFFSTPLAALILVPVHLYYSHLMWQTAVFALVYGAITAMSVTACYHRQLSHRAFVTHPIVEFLFLVIGAASFQGPALKWCTDHRRHHRMVDTDKDPYSIKKGFWYAHIGWILLQDDEEYRGKYSPDLLKDKLVVWQDRYYVWVATFMCFFFPAIVGLLWKDPIGCFVYVGVLRLVVNHHCTFLINSACHMFGRQTYGDANTAKDSVVLAVLTFGEGYHNYHHHFQADYRNGIRWYDWDPTKWMIQTLASMGLANKLREYSSVEVLRARLKAEERRIAQAGAPIDRLASIRAKVEESQLKWQAMKADYRRKRAEMSELSREKLEQMRADVRQAKLEFKASMAQWAETVRSMRTQFAAS